MFSFYLPPKNIFGEDVEGEHVLKWVKETKYWNVFSTIEYNEMTLSIQKKKNSQHKLKKKSRKSKLVWRGKNHLCTATKVFENYNFSCGMTSLLTRK